MVAVALCLTGHHPLGGRLSALLDSFLLSPRGFFLRDSLRSSALGHALLDSHFQRWAGLSPMVAPPSATTLDGAAYRLASRSAAVFGSGGARLAHGVVYANVSRAASGKRTSPGAPTEHDVEPRYGSCG